MRAYLEFGKKSFQRAMTYRAATLAGVATNFFFGMVRVMVFTAFYESAVRRPEMPLWQAISYVWLVQVLLAISFSAFANSPFVEDIRTGAVAVQLIRPVDFQACWFANDIARILQTVLMRGAPIAFFATLFFGMRPPASGECALLFLASALMAMAVAVAISQVVGAAAFWTLDATGPINMAATLSLFFSGMLVPLALWPAWLRGIAAWMPFPSLMDTPLCIYLGRYAGAAAVRQIGVQALWAVLLLAAARGLIARGFRKLEVQGG